MSVTVNYFVNFPGQPQEFVAQLRRWLGCDLRREECRDEEEDLTHYRCVFMGMGCELWDGHGLENDGELDFESFRYQLALLTSPPAFWPLQLFTVASIAYVLYQRLGITGMLVHETERLLARYDARPDAGGACRCLFDTVSNRVVEFPGHFHDLLARTGRA